MMKNLMKLIAIIAAVTAVVFGPTAYVLNTWLGNQYLIVKVCICALVSIVVWIPMCSLSIDYFLKEES